MAYSKKDSSVFTDPKLVEHIIARIGDHGFVNISVVESQNVYGNWFENREVKKVAKYFGYSGNGYKIVDITKQMVPYKYQGRLGNHYAGPTWRDADFRISFAKNKTHASYYYTLTLKNLYGTAPLQNKFLEYHKKREVDEVTIDILATFPVDFGLIDAYLSADGLLGLKEDLTPKLTKTIIGGENLLAVDTVGAMKMGLNPSCSKIFRLALERFGKPHFKWLGNKMPYEDWDNVPSQLDEILDIVEEFYLLSNLGSEIISSVDSYFKWKRKKGIKMWLLQILRKIILSIYRWYDKYFQ